MTRLGDCPAFATVTVDAAATKAARPTVGTAGDPGAGLPAPSRREKSHVLVGCFRHSDNDDTRRASSARVAAGKGMRDHDADPEDSQVLVCRTGVGCWMAALRAPPPRPSRQGD